MLCSMYLHDQVVAAMLAVRELTVECHTQVPCGLGGGNIRFVDGNSKLIGGRAFCWKEKKLVHIKIVFQVVCRHPLREVSQTGRDLCCYLCFRWGKRED